MRFGFRFLVQGFGVGLGLSRLGAGGLRSLRCREFQGLGVLGHGASQLWVQSSSGYDIEGVDFRFRDLVFEGSISSGAGVLSAPEILGEGARLGRLSSLGEVCAARLFPVKIWFLCQKTMSFCGGIQSCDMQVISVLKGCRSLT